MTESYTISKKRFPWRRTLAFLLIVTVTIIACVALVKTGPKAMRKPPAPMQANVKVRSLERTNSQIVIDVMGSVIPQRAISLSAQVSGEVIELGEGFSEGSYLQRGDFLLKIDERDYQTALASAEATLELKMSDLAIESGNQTIAKREWELLHEASELQGANASLALREPQQKSVEAEVAMARAALSEAELDLSRTQITAPFNAIVLEKSVDLGSYVSTQSAVANLAGADAYWIRAAVPKSQLKWLDIPGPNNAVGSIARVYPNADQTTYREGRITALLGDLDPAGRMARVLITVEDPLSKRPDNADQPMLLLGDFVRVELIGKELENVFELPREAFRDGGRVWLASSSNQLEIRPVQPVWQGDEFVLVGDGLSEGERLVLTNLAMPTPGLKLVLSDESGTSLASSIAVEATRGGS